MTYAASFVLAGYGFDRDGRCVLDKLLKVEKKLNQK
jgi:hypothetical protein